jgi:hypothetical protein
MSEREPELIYSRLCRDFTRDGYRLEVKIYRLGDRPGWQLEVVNEEGTSTVWDDLFATDREANEAFLETLDEDGVAAFLDDDDDSTVVPFPGGRLH